MTQTQITSTWVYFAASFLFSYFHVKMCFILQYFSKRYEYWKIDRLDYA